MHDSRILTYLLDPALGPRHAIIIDPPNQAPEVAALRALAAVRAGSRMILVGGSTDVTPANTANTVAAIQNQLDHLANGAQRDGDPAASDWRVPVVLFPCGANGLCAGADASLFPMLLNSRDRRYLVGEPLSMAPLIQRFGIVPVSMAYLVCRPGGAVGRVADVDLIERNDLERVSAYASVAAYYGFRLVYLEAGSGADQPVPGELVAAAKAASGLPVISSGSICSAKDAFDAVAAGADWVVTGSLTEAIADPTELTARLRDLVEAMDEAAGARQPA
jgi:phosphoglycerol geranylgeranyltransferase